MKHFFPIFIIFLSFYIYSCANQGTPTGGEKDTIPPILLESFPPNKSINFKKRTFKFVFNEKINADKVKNKLIITPHIENNVKIKYKKYGMVLEFENDFGENTTYTLNFADGLVDITEKNPAENLTLAFSTGSYIDSIYINGRITELFTNQNQQNILVALYLYTDTLDILKDKPKYFAHTGEEGIFNIENIKSESYKIVAYNDINKNLMLNPETEAHGFLSDAINLNQSIDSIKIATIQINAQKLQLLITKNLGKYYDVQYNKGLEIFMLSKLNSLDKLPIPKYNLIKENQIIRFYPHTNFKFNQDSLAIRLTALDSLTNQSIDTIYVKFKASKRKLAKFKASISPEDNSTISEKVTHTIQFDKPIIKFYKDSIQYQYDTLRSEPILDSTITWNKTRTEVSFSTLLDQNWLSTTIDSLMTIYNDTTSTDTLAPQKINKLIGIDIKKITVQIPKGTFISIDQDSSKSLTSSYRFQSIDQVGTVSGTVETEYTSYTIQLVTEQYEVIKEVINKKHFQFNHIIPGKYTFRIFVDENMDGNWFHGNILKNQTPEYIYFYPEIFDVRSNWDLENIIINLNKNVDNL